MRRDPGQGEAGFLSRVDQLRAFPSRIVDRGQPPGRRPPSSREELQRVRHLIERLDAVYPVSVEQGLVRAVLSGQGARVRRHQVFRGGGSPDLEGDDRDLLLCRPGQGRLEGPRIARGLHEQRDQLRARPAQGVVDVVRCRGDQLEAGGNREVEPKAPVVVKHRGECRTGMAHERDGPRLQVLRLGEPARAETTLDVEETHPVSAAQGHAGRAGDARQPLGEGRPAFGRALVATGEDHCGTRPGVRRGLELCFELCVGEAEQCQVDWLGQVGQRWKTTMPLDLVVFGIDGVDGAVEAAPEQLEHHLLPERTRTRARADHGHRPGLQHGFESSADPAGQRRPRFRSAAIPRAAFAPGPPVTPPPGCAPDPHRYRPASGIR